MGRHPRSTTRISRVKVKKMTQEEKTETPKEFYIAHDNEGRFDEVQRLALAYRNRHPVAIEGEPGVGKNQALKVIAAASGRKMYRVRCTEEMTARDIVGGEKLSVEKVGDNIATKTVYQPGKLYQGMLEGSIVLIDEVNQLNHTVQKALNSALEDIRTISYLDGLGEVKAENGFGLFMTYNPETGIANQDLESAVKDRCKLLYFRDLPPELKLRIALMRTEKFSAEDFLGDGLSLRGLTRGKLDFLEHINNTWMKFNQETQLKGNDIEPYFYYNKSKARPLSFKDKMKMEYYTIGRAIVNTLDRIASLRKNGTTEIGNELGIRLDEVSRLNVNTPSQRMIIKLIEDYMMLRNMGYESTAILGETAQSIVDATVPARERELPIGNKLTVEGLIKQIAAANGIIDNSMLAEMKNKTSAKARNEMVRELMERGYLESVAQRMVNEYA